MDAPAGWKITPAKQPFNLVSAGERKKFTFKITAPKEVASAQITARAANVADSVMYREALAAAAESRGWSVHWYDRERVFRDAAAALVIDGGQSAI